MEIFFATRPFLTRNKKLIFSEFIEVGKETRALDTLQEVFRNKKYSYTWSESIMEPIMMKYLELCVELKKSHIAKEGLFQYRNMFQLVRYRIFRFWESTKKINLIRSTLDRLKKSFATI